jgi:hypothetical protein
MKYGLNIPLGEPTTRRTSWRVVWIIFFCLCAILFSWSVFRIITTHDKTSHLYPTQRTSTIRIIKTPRTVKLLQENIGNKPIIAGTTWTLTDILQKSRFEFAIHLKDDQIIAITLDDTLTPKDISTLESNGILVQEKELITIIGKGEFADKKISRVSISRLLPWHDGEFYNVETQETRSIAVKKTGIFIKSGHGAKNYPENATIGENTELIAHVPLPLITPDIPLISANIATATLLNDVFLKSEYSSATLALTRDDKGLVSKINLISNSISIENLAHLAEQLISQFKLSTLELTIEDGSTVQELRSNSRLVESSVNTEGELTFIESKGPLGNQISIQKNNDAISIINRDFSALDSQISTSSSCLSNAQIILKTPQLIDLITNQPAELEQHQGRSSILLIFNEVAVNKYKTALCW